MSIYGHHPPLKRDSEPIDNAVWHWFICNGPHGENFSWHKEMSFGARDIDVLREFIEEKTNADHNFISKARVVAREALSNDNPIIICTAIQILAIIGDEIDFIKIKTLTDNSDENIAINARCCLFENGIKIKKSKA